MLKLDPQNHITEVPAFCGLPFSKAILTVWGEVSMCCHQLTQLGKLDETTDVLDIWRSPVAKEIRRDTMQGSLHRNCTSWNACPFITQEKKSYPQETYSNSNFPLYLEICLPDKHCNVGGENPTEENPACIMCRRNFDIPHQPDITDFLCEKSRSLMPYLRHLCVLGIAEPFWKNATFNIYDKLGFDEHSHHITYYTHTNGITMREELARTFFERTPWSEISWSLDAVTRDTFRKIRRMDVFETVCQNLERFLKMRHEYGGPAHHRVNIYNNINLLNVHEMSKMVEMAHSLQVDKLMLLPTTDQLGVVQLGELILNRRNVDIFREAAEKAVELSQQLGVHLQLVKRFDVVAPSVEELHQIQGD